MPTQIIKPFRARTMRLTRLDPCCTPPDGGTPCSVIVMDGFLTVTLTADVEDGEEFVTKKASGDLCVNERLPDALKRLDASIELCEIDPEAVEMLTGWPLALDSEGDSVGFDVIEGINDAEVAIELWTGISGQDCDPEVGERFGYLALPCLQGVTLDGDLAFAQEPTEVTLAGRTSSQHAWGSGPFAVEDDGTGSAGPLVTALDADSHARLQSVTISPPSLTSECADMPTSP